MLSRNKCRCIYIHTPEETWSNQGFVGPPTSQAPGKLALVRLRLPDLIPPREVSCDVTLVDDRERLKSVMSSSPFPPRS